MLRLRTGLAVFAFLSIGTCSAAAPDDLTEALRMDVAIPTPAALADLLLNDAATRFPNTAALCAAVDDADPSPARARNAAPLVTEMLVLMG